MKSEPILIIDKSKGKETYLVIDPSIDFEEAVKTAQKLSPDLYEGEWSLIALEPNANTNKIISIAKSETLNSYIDKQITTFYWQYSQSNKYVNPYQYDRNQKSNSGAAQWSDKPRATPTSLGGAASEGAIAKMQQVKYATNGTKIASIEKRIVSLLIDSILFFILFGFFNTFISNEWFLSVLLWWLYFAFMESSSYQGTIGKIATGIKVTDLNGNRISFSKSTVRAFGRWLSSFTMGIGYIIAAFNDKRQTLHDIIANTIVTERE